jgi:molybdopterin-binding protein
MRASSQRAVLWGDHQTLGRSIVKLSARNQIPARVRSVTHGAVNSEVVLELADGSELVSVITKRSAESLGLAAGQSVRAVVKATNVMIATD